MSDEKDINRISRIIIHTIKGEATPAESTEARWWRDEHEDNEKVFARLTERFPMEDYERFAQARRRDGWDSIRQKIGKGGRRRSFRLKWAIPVAAAILTAVSMSILRHNAPDTPPTVRDLAPGVAKATLILPTGEQIHVDGGSKDVMDSLAMIGLYDAGPDSNTSPTAETPPQIHTWTVPRGGEFFLTLSDGTSVWLNSESRLTYPSHFDGERRSVTFEGEAYFKVAHDPDRPFVVESRGMSITVTGTEFNVNTYDPGAVSATLVEGSVQVRAGSMAATLAPGQQAVYDRVAGTLSAREVDTSVCTAWKEGIFEFRNQRFDDIAAQLSRWYDVEFAFDDSSVADIRFTGAFRRGDSLNAILEVFRHTRSVDYRIDENRVTLERK